MLNFSDWNLNDTIHTMIAECHLPFQFVGQPSFQRLVELLQPGTVIPGHSKIRDICYSHVAEIEASLIDELPVTALISLALDVWTSQHQQSFLGVQMYFITDDWQYRECLLGFKPLVNSHTGWEMANVVHSLLVKHKLCKWLLTVTADNAASNGTMWQNLSIILKWEENVVWNCQEGTI